MKTNDSCNRNMLMPLDNCCKQNVNKDHSFKYVHI